MVRKIIIRGRVQFVAYRRYCVKAGNAIGVQGWVQNRPDGSVEVVAQGSADQMRQLVEWIWKGTILSKTRAVEVVEYAGTVCETVFVAKK
jgi:acylphosphatase